MKLATPAIFAASGAGMAQLQAPEALLALVAIGLLTFLGSIYVFAGLLARQDQQQDRASQGTHCFSIGVGMLVFGAVALISVVLA